MISCKNTLSFSVLLLSLACGPAKEKVRYEYIDTSTPSVQDPNQSGPLNPVTCKGDFVSLCAEVQSRIDLVQGQIDASSKAGFLQEMYAAQLNLNELLEIRDAYQNGVRDVTNIQQRYGSLRQMMADNGQDIKAMGALNYQKEELAAVREVFNAFGELSLDPAQVAAANVKPTIIVLNASESATPWAGYWYPKRGKDLFDGDNAPLAKFDRYLQAQNKPSSIVQWEVGHFDNSAAEWEGMCDAWAMASVSMLEPKKAQTIDGIEFSVGDLKGLATKYYEGYKPQIFGRRYQGQAATDGMIQDLRPEGFHKIVEEYLGKRKQPIIIDEDPGPEVWSKPMFRIALSMSMDPERTHAVRVKAFPWLTRQRSLVDNALTSKATDLAAPAYEYRLYFDPTPLADGRLKVIAGEWLGGSLNFHPDTVSLPQKAENQDQINPDVKANHDDLRKLLEKAGMIPS